MEPKYSIIKGQHFTYINIIVSNINSFMHRRCVQGSKIALVRSYLRVPQAAGQVKILIFLVKIIFFRIYTNIFVMQGKCLF